MERHIREILTCLNLTMMPNMTVMAPKIGRELEKMLEFAVHAAGPCAIRYPKGTAYQGLEEFDSPITFLEKSEVLSVERKQHFCLLEA